MYVHPLIIVERTLNCQEKCKKSDFLVEGDGARYDGVI